MKIQNVFVIAIVISLGLTAFAQDSTPKVELSIDYSYVRFNPAHAYVPNTYSLNGGGGAIDFNFSKYIGFVAEFEGYSSNTQRFTIPAGSLCPAGCSGNVQANLLTYMFGPQIGIRSGKFRPFAHVLLGGAHSNAGGNLYTDIGSSAARPSANAFALTFGGGLDIPVTRSGSISIRPAEIDYLYTDFNIGGSGGNSNVRYQAGVVFNFGGAPEIPVAAACSVDHGEVMVGEPLHVTVSASNFTPKHPLAYAWTSNGGRISGKDTGASIDTNGAAPGSYTATATVTDPKKKKNNTASCSSNFTVKPLNPPQMSCSANPITVEVGTASTISCTCTSPDNATVTVGSWTASAGSVSGSGNAATLNTTGAAAGPVTVTATCTDSRGLTASSSSTVTVNNLPPPPPAPPQATKVNECQYPNAKKPWRVDNTCKAELDDVALKLQQDPDAKLVVVGNAEPTEKRKNLAAERALNVKAYISGGEAKQNIDATRIETRTGNAGTMTSEQWIVPAGATFPETDSTAPVDETAVMPVPDHPKPAAKKTN